MARKSIPRPRRRALRARRPPDPRVVRRLPQLRRAITALRARHELGKSGKGAKAAIALVPTMGALHEGHLSLVRLAQRFARHVVVSIFVNPAQFAPHEDFRLYPRTFDADLAALAALPKKIDLVWAPAADTMYHAGFATKILPEGPALAGLEDAFRPHFFAGVATVVAKLLIQCAPDIAVFGEKDYQQLLVIRQLARDLDLKIRIIGAPIVREADGLALSSRNAYLTPRERQAAPALYRALKACASAIAAGAPLAATLRQGRATIRRAGFALDYLEARRADTLAPIGIAAEGPIRLLVAARIGNTRLIDNVRV